MDVVLFPVPCLSRNTLINQAWCWGLVYMHLGLYCSILPCLAREWMLISASLCICWQSLFSLPDFQFWRRLLILMYWQSVLKVPRHAVWICLRPSIRSERLREWWSVRFSSSHNWMEWQRQSVPNFRLRSWPPSRGRNWMLLLLLMWYLVWWCWCSYLLFGLPKCLILVKKVKK